jgi:hypothetical protein
MIDFDEKSHCMSKLNWPVRHLGKLDYKKLTPLHTFRSIQLGIYRF